jgi:phage terminase large subunit-like protein
MQDEMRRRNQYPIIKQLLHSGTNKETRIRGLIGRWESKSIYFVGDCSDLEQEMRVFPRGSHDDVLDALAYQEQIAYQPTNYQDINDILGDDEPLYASIGL